jgi:hypothetical protein
MYFLLEPCHKRFAICTSPKVACVSLRMWLWEMSGLPRTTSSIFREFDRFTIRPGESLPESVEATIAVHRDGISRLRAVYDHRIRREREGPDHGLDHFARHLPEYCARFPVLAHHCCAQSALLGSQLDAYTDVLPLGQLELIRGIVSEVIGAETPPLPVIHKTSRATEVSEEAAHWFERWTAHDTAIGWDGKTMRVVDAAEPGDAALPVWEDGKPSEVEKHHQSGA